MAWTYILGCADGSLYVGSARALDTRLQQHHDGVADSFTGSRRPVELLWSQEFDSIGEAYAMERRIHGWRRAKKLALVEGRLGDLPKLARSRVVRRT